jgi:hypothetical protein
MGDGLAALLEELLVPGQLEQGRSRGLRIGGHTRPGLAEHGLAVVGVCFGYVDLRGRGVCLGEGAQHHHVEVEIDRVKDSL